MVGAPVHMHVVCMEPILVAHPTLSSLLGSMSLVLILVVRRPIRSVSSDRGALQTRATSGRARPRLQRCGHRSSRSAVARRLACTTASLTASLLSSKRLRSRPSTTLTLLAWFAAWRVATTRLACSKARRSTVRIDQSNRNLINLPAKLQT